MGLGCPAPAGMGWTTPAGVGAAATAIQLLGIHGDAGLGSRLQPVGVLALRCVDPAVTNGGALGPSEPLFSLIWFSQPASCSSSSGNRTGPSKRVEACMPWVSGDAVSGDVD